MHSCTQIQQLHWFFLLLNFGFSLCGFFFIASLLLVAFVYSGLSDPEALEGSYIEAPWQVFIE